MSKRMTVAFGAALAAVCLWAAPVAARQAAEGAAPAAEHAAAEPHANPAAGSHDAGAGAAGAVATHAETPAHEAHGDTHAAGAHGGEHAAATPHLPNVINLLLNVEVDPGVRLKDTHIGHVIHNWEMQIFMIIVTAIGIFLLWTASKLRAAMPTRTQAFFEMVHEGFYGFFGGILGHDNLKYVPFLGSLFMFIYLQNVAGIFPFMTGGTGAYTTTLALALMVFFYVQINGIRAAGFGHWAMHFLGNPKDAFGWVMGIAMLPLEIIGALAKPLSLSLRLFGNMMGEHILVGVFLLMGLGLVQAFLPNTIIGVPLHLPFLFLALLTTFIQALVFSLLSTIYLLLLLPHDDHHEDEMHDMEHDNKHGMRDDHGMPVTAGDISPV